VLRLCCENDEEDGFTTMLERKMDTIKILLAEDNDGDILLTGHRTYRCLTAQSYPITYPPNGGNKKPV